MRSGPISTIAKSVHGFVSSEVLGEREPAVGHLVDLAQEVLLVVGAEVLRVEEVLADDLRDLVLERGRVRVLRSRATA